MASVVRGRGRARRWAVALLVLLLAGAVVLVAVLPALLKARLASEAKSRGIDLTVESASVSWAEVSFSRLHGTDPSAPSVTFDADRVRVRLSGLTPSEIVLERPIVTLADGEKSIAAARAIEARLRSHGGASTSGAPGGQGKAPTVTVSDGSVVVDNVPVGALGLVARGLRGAIDGAGATFVMEGELAVLQGGKPFRGPWPLAWRRTPEGDEQVVRLAPAAPEAATLKRVTRGASAHVELRVKAQKASAIGLVDIAAFPADATLDVDIAHDKVGPKTSGRVHVATSRLNLKGAAMAAKAQLSFRYEGDEKVARLADGTFAFGPLQGTASGSASFGASPKVHLELASAKTPCLNMVRSAREDALPGLGAAMAAFGLERAVEKAVTGDVSISAILDLDVARPDEARVVFTPNGGCSVELPFFPALRVTP